MKMKQQQQQKNLLGEIATEKTISESEECQQS